MSMKNVEKEKLNIILTIVIIMLTAGLGSLFVNLGMQWYFNLNSPSQWIPNIVIPIVWSIIYILFAVILSILYKQNLIDSKITILAIINAVLNILWCLVFFTLNQLLLGLILIIINAFVGCIFLYNLLKIKKWYINLLLIYPIWLFIATSLNLALWILN